ncbi:hypothetical protein GCM10011579_032130 [Streptomyces albiflavescens]|uniref:Uncharacterized protein n=1 Tax=Streptomyces albiflavescens TaxID=1623582 RepID=A0A917Y2M7_9ACTN|nr:hypothetical protein GCM10011579_032130 [Streptomyces albiflavescens]
MAHTRRTRWTPNCPGGDLAVPALLRRNPVHTMDPKPAAAFGRDPQATLIPLADRTDEKRTAGNKKRGVHLTQGRRTPGARSSKISTNQSKTVPARSSRAAARSALTTGRLTGWQRARRISNCRTVSG